MLKVLLNTSVLLILVSVTYLVWYGYRNALGSQNVSARIQPQKTKTTEEMNKMRLNGLFVNTGLRVDDSAMLPQMVGQSQTITARLQNADKNVNEDLSEQISENYDVSLLEVKSETGALSRQRVFELSPYQILVVAINAQNQILWWNLQPDPRVLRGETADDAGNLSGKTLYRKRAEFLISIPADPSITEIRFYHPVWDGADYSVLEIGGLNL